MSTTIESSWENERLKDELASRDADVAELTRANEDCVHNAKNALDSMQQQNDQLREQVRTLRDALSLWKVASDNSEESELDDMACYCIPMPLFCDADEAMEEALAATDQK